MINRIINTLTATLPLFYLYRYLYHPVLEECGVISPSYDDHMAGIMGAIKGRTHKRLWNGPEAIFRWLTLTRPTGLRWGPVGSQSYKHRQRQERR